MYMSVDRRKARGKLAQAHQALAKNPEDRQAAAAVEEHGREYWTLELQDHIRRVVDQAPPLTDEQVDRIVAVLRPRYDGPTAA